MLFRSVYYYEDTFWGKNEGWFFVDGDVYIYDNTDLSGSIRNDCFIAPNNYISVLPDLAENAKIGITEARNNYLYSFNGYALGTMIDPSTYPQFVKDTNNSA